MALRRCNTRSEAPAARTWSPATSETTNAPAQRTGASLAGVQAPIAPHEHRPRRAADFASDASRDAVRNLHVSACAVRFFVGGWLHARGGASLGGGGRDRRLRARLRSPDRR